MNCMTARTMPTPVDPIVKVLVALLFGIALIFFIDMAGESPITKFITNVLTYVPQR